MLHSLSLNYILTLSLIFLSLMKTFCIFLIQERSVDKYASLDITIQDTLLLKHRVPTKVYTKCISTVSPLFLFHILLYNLARILYPPMMLLPFLFFLILILIFLIMTFRLLFEKVNAFVLLIFYLILSLILICRLQIVLLFLMWYILFASFVSKPYLSQEEACHKGRNAGPRTEWGSCCSFTWKESSWMSLRYEVESCWVIR